ncbi:NIF3-like protein 1 [Hondaea fermentalgiana]|uniref:NIF3-like protein 1 n=1 Tax=Hondaea fermentalgiana TaxID=2315210 RepID=A0A2R5GIV7_9STRA|nr:NIF3-like protein 1 [Hondaea fermentalgiana]|eukprot:GBG30827.1 NIF3-like protein 1 [Hondaea fermentalgiana]
MAQGYRRRLQAELERLFPLKLAESWDNTGLLVDPGAEPAEERSGILLTNDLTEAVVQEAVDLNVGFIYTYHPMPFRGQKRLTQEDATQRIVTRCIREDIVVYSPHTACDNAFGGVNDWLAASFGSDAQVKPVVALEGDGIAAGSGRGRRITLPSSRTLGQAIDDVKHHAQVPHARFAPANKLLEAGVKRDSTSVREILDSTSVKSVAVQAGSGISVLANVVDVDLWVTGEASHHDVLAANAQGVSVVLLEHSNSERAFLPTLAKRLAEACDFVPAHAIHVSKVDADPLHVV